MGGSFTSETRLKLDYAKFININRYVRQKFKLYTKIRRLFIGLVKAGDIICDYT